MNVSAQMRQWIVLGVGFAASTAVALGLVGPYHGWEGESLVHRYLTIFLMPITGTAIYVLLRSLQKHHAPANGDPMGDDAVQGILFWILAFLVGVHLLMMAVLTGVEAVRPWAQRGVVVLLGVTLTAVGNLLPRTRPNFALGIRTARTLTDRQLWILTHRVSGYVVVAIGVVTMISGLFVSATAAGAAPFIAMIVGAMVVGAYYWRTVSFENGHTGK